MRRLRHFIILLLILILPALYSSKTVENNPKIMAAQAIDLPQIREKGRLSVVTDFNSINYFIYKGQPMGFQYELLNELAKDLDIELDLKVSNNLAANFESLVTGDYDLIASNLTITNARKELVDFTTPYSQTSQVLVQRSLDPKNPALQTMVRNPIDLAGKTIYVHQNSSYSARLQNLEEEIGEDIVIIEVPAETEQLIKMVANGEIMYTISDQNIASVNKSYYPNIDIETAVSFPQNQAWAVRKGSVQLKKAINDWMENFSKTAKYAVIYNKYFNSERSALIVKSDYYYPETGKISRFDEIIKRESAKIGWDWRLVASMIYQESRFNPNVTSWAGAFGIMQLMPGTAKRYGVSKKSSPESQIVAGVKLIKWLDDRFIDEVPDDHERAKFVLAAYNIGYGHVRDAINLTSKYGGNPSLWDNNVETYLLKKSDPAYYKDPVVRSGYCRGNETQKYVKDIIYRYDHYLNMDGVEIALNSK
ncbi:MAG: transporter substrate-binding domain-containing protein [Bacteroidales bacterium]|nr:transporter substrate-binding domain-containing protein [Bacteroidales bacterium]MCB9012968.1 transporter substrate-binding domain-containing protein [Bacteroidales bacterium]